jgi:hypothetical protein
VTGHETPGGEQSPAVTAIHIAPARRIPMRAVECAQVEAGLGIVGDRYHGTKHRHVTVQSQTALDAATEDLGSPVEPGGTRPQHHHLSWRRAHDPRRANPHR